jgi:small subunit ribosomal protein S8
MVGDPIADMLTRIRNASAVHHKTVYIPYSNIKFAIANVLQKHDYIESVSKKGRKTTQVIEINLAYTDDDKAKIKGLERVSKPSRRVYFGVKDIKSVLNGAGALILSTPKGIMAGRDAKRGLVGGEALFKIW